MNRKTLWATTVLTLVVVGSVGASLFLVPSNIDPAHKFSWSENAGWMNWLDADGGADGVFVDTDSLSGYIWIENAGWLNVGDGGGPYANTNETNFGVNILSSGDLYGYAWGENIGWINFDTSSKAPNQARFDAGAGRFRGYAWGENVGWINLNDATHYVGATSTLVPDPPLPDPSVIDKTRFISFSVPGGGETALRVHLVSLHHVDPPYTNGNSVPFTSFEGQCRFVGPPTQYVESVSNGTPFFASQLQCDPYYQDWSTVGLLHVTGSAIVPSSVYQVENVAASCQGNEASCTAVSAPLSISTTRWGDVVDPLNPPSTTSQPDFNDISSLVNKFKSALGAPIKARALLAGTNVTGEIDPSPDLGFTHISACVDAFKGLPYPYAIATCP